MVSIRWFLNDVEQGIGADETTLSACPTRDDAWHASFGLRWPDGVLHGRCRDGANSAPTVTVEWRPTSPPRDMVGRPHLDADGDAVSVETSWYKTAPRCTLTT